MTYLRLTCLGALVLSGCGLINSDVTNFDLTLPDKQFSVDATRWDINQSEADAIFNQSCSGSPQVCMNAAVAACPMNCTATCNTSTDHCELGLQISAHQGIDLVMEKPELKSINDEPIIKVTIDSVTYSVTSNTLSVATPEIKVYVAPMSITDPNDPMAKQVGTIEPVAAMATVAMRDMTFTPDGKQALIDIMSTYKNPFNVMVGSTIIVKQGDPVPTGKLDASVKITAHAGL